MTDPIAKKIQIKKRGNALGYWFFKAFMRAGGLRAAYGLLYGVALHYLIFDRDAVKAAGAYFKRRFPGSGSFARIGQIYRLFVTQGQQLIDRYAAISGAVEFSFVLNGQETLERLSKSEKGFVLLTAHAGNWQIALTTLSNIGKKVFLVMRPEDNEAVKKALNVDATDSMIGLISPEGEFGGVVQIMNQLNAGNVVSFNGDRAYGFDTVDVPFVGGTAKFPFGAFQIAAAAGVPILVLLASKTGPREYTIDVTQTIEPIYAGRRDKRGQLSAWVAQYAAMLDAFFAEHPFQCFLFYDVWINTVK